MIRRLAPALTALVVFASMAISVFMTHDATQSARLAVNAAMSGIGLSAPLVGGIAAADGRITLSPKINAVLSQLTSAAKLRNALRRIGAISFGVVLGVTMAMLLAFVAARIVGSFPTILCFNRIPIAALYIIAFAFVGWGVGAFIPSWFAPPLVAALPLVGLIGNFPFFRHALALFSGNSQELVYFTPHIARFFSSGLLYLCFGLLGLALIWIRISRTVAASVLLASACVVFVGGLALHESIEAELDSAQMQNVYDDSSDWPCIAIDEGANICIPDDQAHELRELPSVLSPYRERLLKIDGTLASWNLSPAPKEQQLGFSLPLGRSAQDQDQAFTMLASVLPECAYPSISEDREWERADMATLILLYIQQDVIPSSEAPNLTEVKQLYSELKACE